MKRRMLVVTTIVVVTAVVLQWLTPISMAKLGQSVFDQIDLLVDVRHEIVRGYVEDPDEKKMVETAVRAMVASLGDRYTVFLTKEELEPFDKQVRGTFSGIGAEIDIFDNRLRIVSPLEDSPAWKSGVMASDIVLEIEGESTEGITVTEAVSKLTGPEGTQVTIRVRHDSGDEEEIVITRARISVQTVRGFKRDGDNHWDYMLDPINHVGYIRITQFTGNTTEGVRQALDHLISHGARGLILDMRFNPGGMLDAAVGVSDMFLTADKRIVSIKGRSVSERVHRSTDGGTIAPIPLVVLANEASASASEIVTGALLDNKRGVFIGTRTFGKGSVQQVRMLENGQGALKITNAYYYLPNGRNIHRREDKDVWGVDPDEGFYVSMSFEQMRKMIDIRRESPLLRAGGSDESLVVTPQWIEDELADLQLAAALRAVQGKLDTGDWPIVGQSGADELVKQSQLANLIRQRDLLNERLDLVKYEISKLDDPDPDPEEESKVSGDIEVEGEDTFVAEEGAVEAEPAAESPEPEPAVSSP